MVDRTIFWAQNQSRTFDLVEGDHDVLTSSGFAIQDILGGVTTVVEGLAAAPTGPASLTVNLADGRLYQQAEADASATGAIPLDSTLIMQQGFFSASSIVFSTTGITAGQSRWALIQAQFAQTDSIRAGDPNSGLLYFYNSVNPAQPWQGPNNDLQTTPTVRKGLCLVQVITGASATTGSEVPPSPTSGWVPLYLVDLTYGQTAITSGDILIAGPSVGTGVPSNYPYAPFLAGLLNSHHNGTTGQAPKINLATEVQGVLPIANMSALGGRLLNVQVFNTNGTYTPTTGTNSIIVAIQAPGGGTGGIPSTSAGASGGNTPGGSGSGAVCRYTSGFTGGIVVTVGAAGAAGSSVGPTAGGNGGTASFGSLINCPGGNGGSVGVVATGAVKSDGTPSASSPTGSGILYSSIGGDSSGFLQVTYNVAIVAGTVPGPLFGFTFGAGAPAILQPQSHAAQTGGTGGPGLVLVYEYA